VQNANKSFRDFLENADLVVADSQYTEKEYEQKHGWGHSTFECVYQLAKDARVKKLVFFHHDPARTDVELDEIRYSYLQNLKKDCYNNYPNDIMIAKEQECIEV
jgi:ribonuclease BN (tRNA processing enzyme)